VRLRRSTVQRTTKAQVGERGERERERGSSGRERRKGARRLNRAGEGHGEPGRNDRPSTPSMAVAINSALSERG
jgi:hypothetical protein